MFKNTSHYAWCDRLTSPLEMWGKKSCLAIWQNCATPKTCSVSDVCWGVTIKNLGVRTSWGELPYLCETQRTNPRPLFVNCTAWCCSMMQFCMCENAARTPFCGGRGDIRIKVQRVSLQAGDTYFKILCAFPNHGDMKRV